MRVTAQRRGVSVSSALVAARLVPDYAAKPIPDVPVRARMSSRPLAGMRHVSCTNMAKRDCLLGVLRDFTAASTEPMRPKASTQATVSGVGLPVLLPVLSTARCALNASSAKRDGATLGVYAAPRAPDVSHSRHSRVSVS